MNMTYVAVVNKNGGAWCIVTANPTMYNVEMLCEKLSHQYRIVDDVVVYEIPTSKYTQYISESHIAYFGKVVYSWEYGFTDHGVSVLKDDIGYHIVEKMDGDE